MGWEPGQVSHSCRPVCAALYTRWEVSRPTLVYCAREGYQLAEFARSCGRGYGREDRIKWH